MRHINESVSERELMRKRKRKGEGEKGRGSEGVGGGRYETAVCTLRWRQKVIQMWIYVHQFSNERKIIKKTERPTTGDEESCRIDIFEWSK